MLMIRILGIFGLLLSFGRIIIIDVSYRKSGTSFNSAIEVMIWCSDIIISLKSGFSFEYCTPSGLRRVWWCSTAQYHCTVIGNTYNYILERSNEYTVGVSQISTKRDVLYVYILFVLHATHVDIVVWDTRKSFSLVH